MKLDKAKKILASFLSGYENVAPEDLKLACEIANADGDYVSHILQEFGLDGNWVNTCEIFRVNVAEFSELSREEQKKEMPCLLDHLESCPECRSLYWSIKPHWAIKAGSGVTQKLKKVCKTLSEDLHIVFDSVGTIKESLKGPPSLKYAAVAGVMGGEIIEDGIPSQHNIEESRRKEWIFEDEDFDCFIRLTVFSAKDDEVEVSIELGSRTDGAIDIDTVRVEIIDNQDSVFLSGRLADVQSEPIIIPKGKWRFFLTLYENGVESVWEIPVE